MSVSLCLSKVVGGGSSPNTMKYDVFDPGPSKMNTYLPCRVGAQNLCAIEASTTKVERRPPCCDAKVVKMRGEIKEYPTGAKPPHIGAPSAGQCPSVVYTVDSLPGEQPPGRIRSRAAAGRRRHNVKEVYAEPSL